MRPWRIRSRSAKRSSRARPPEHHSKNEETVMSQLLNHQRRRFLGLAAGTIAVTKFGIVGSASAQAQVPAVKPGTNTSLGPLRQIDAGVLNVGYTEAGPAGGRVVILLHGWPYDIHSYADVVPLLV